jgi:hypothetical protein
MPTVVELGSIESRAATKADLAAEKAELKQDIAAL